MPDDVRREAEELIRYYGEIVRRLGQAGIKDVPDLLALYEQLRRALAAISTHELSWAAEETTRLVNKLLALDASLQAMRRLKATLQGDGQVPPGSSTPEQAH
jgi:hypothetical protein